MGQSEQFQYYKNKCLDGVTLLSARMTAFAYPRHSHEEYSFGVTLSGDQHFFSQGEYHISKAGNVILFNPEDVHDGNSGRDEALRYMMLYVPPSLLRSYMESAGLPQGYEFKITDPVLNHTGLHNAILGLAQFTLSGNVDPIEQEAELCNLAILLAETYGEADEISPSGRVDALVVKAKAYIRENIARDITLDELGAELNISKFHFLRLFRRQLGITPYQYVLSCRVNQARKALETAKSVNDVVYDFGFADVSHFNRRFKSVFGVTPTSYMKGLSS